ncbi:MAG: MmgE/PrpD family protein [Burkholderiaceae bacterium]|nr:MmgE/PrpD family protein [Burkholderiaceae bacterium]
MGDRRPETLSESLWREAKALRYDALPTPVVDKIKDLTLDTLGVALGSASLDFGVATRELMRSWNSAGGASAIGESRRAPPHAAALVNGVLAHGQDFDDTHTESVTHPSACVIPAALAVAESRGASGRDAIVTMAAGFESMIRLALPARNQFHLHGFHTTSIAGTFAAALIASRLAGLDDGSATNALGVSGSFTSGLLECVPAGAGSKRLHAGWAAMGGIIAADLAGRGLTGPDTVFEGKLGVFNSFVRGESINLAEILDGFGVHWSVLDTRPKLYPCCHYLQSFIDCARRLRDERGVRPADIASIRCRVAQGSVNMICTPWATKQAPRDTYEAKFSLPFAVAIALHDGCAGTSEFTLENAQRPEIAALMARVNYEVDPSFSVKDMPGDVEISLLDGRIERCVQQRVRGDRDTPISRAELLDKFHDNVRVTAFAHHADTIATTVLNLDTQRDLEALGSLLRGGK